MVSCHCFLSTSVMGYAANVENHAFEEMSTECGSHGSSTIHKGLYSCVCMT